MPPRVIWAWESESQGLSTRIRNSHLLFRFHLYGRMARGRDTQETILWLGLGIFHKTVFLKSGDFAKLGGIRKKRRLGSKKNVFDGKLPQFCFRKSISPI